MSINQISGIIGLLGDVSSPIKDYSFQALVLDLEVWTRRRMHLKFGLKKIEYIRSIRWRTIVDSICDGINFGQHYIR
ncbi:uncharacterized protein OCT59_003737 [Rhizophagus irregularis]|uniref:uncharacterized protein n=1 Tax=Rhizophagus irregularis TaxID=588596 RepID=UPI00331E5ED3|nr:hypothetical protein OCT59_003737 [Rhizophagus irregularis]